MVVESAIGSHERFLEKTLRAFDGRNAKINWVECMLKILQVYWNDTEFIEWKWIVINPIEEEFWRRVPSRVAREVQTTRENASLYFDTLRRDLSKSRWLN